MSSHGASSSWDLGFSCPIKLSAPADGKPDDVVRFAGEAYSGGVVPDYGWMGDIAIDLATLKNPDGEVPVLTDHERSVDAIAGRGRLRITASADGSRSLAIEGQLTSATESGKRMASLLREGYPIQMSVGLSAKRRESGEDETINGRQMKVAHVFEHATVREVSFVPVGADADTNASQTFSFSAVEAHQSKGASMARSADDQSLIDSQAAEIAQLKAQVAEATKAAKEAADGARKASLSALFKEVGRDEPKDVAPYVEMSEAAFAAFSADLRAMKVTQTARKTDSALFSSQSAGRANEQDQPQERGALLLAAVNKLIKA